MIKVVNLNMKDSMRKTEEIVESKKDFILTRMAKAIAHQKEVLESSHWEIDYIEEDQERAVLNNRDPINGFFTAIIHGEDDVCEQVLASFIEEHELEEMDLTEASFVDDARDMQHELISHLVDLYNEGFSELNEALEDSESEKFELRIRNEFLDLYYDNELIATKDTEVGVIDLKVNARTRLVSNKIEEMECHL